MHTNLPDTQSSYLIENFGYCFAFILVFLGCLQLFTENTITTVLPVVGKPSAASFSSLMRLWVIGLTANFIGAFAAVACLFEYTSAAAGCPGRNQRIIRTCEWNARADRLCTRNFGGYSCGRHRLTHARGERGIFLDLPRIHLANRCGRFHPNCRRFCGNRLSARDRRIVVFNAVFRFFCRCLQAMSLVAPRSFR